MNKQSFMDLANFPQSLTSIVLHLNMNRDRTREDKVYGNIED